MKKKIKKQRYIWVIDS